MRIHLVLSIRGRIECALGSRGGSAPIRRMYPDKTVSVPFEGNIHLSGGEEESCGGGEEGGRHCPRFGMGLRTYQMK